MCVLNIFCVFVVVALLWLRWHAACIISLPAGHNSWWWHTTTKTKTLLIILYVVCCVDTFQQNRMKFEKKISGVLIKITHSERRITCVPFWYVMCIQWIYLHIFFVFFVLLTKLKKMSRSLCCSWNRYKRVSMCNAHCACRRRWFFCCYIVPSARYTKCMLWFPIKCPILCLDKRFPDARKISSYSLTTMRCWSLCSGVEQANVLNSLRSVRTPCVLVACMRSCGVCSYMSQDDHGPGQTKTYSFIQIPSQFMTIIFN